MNRRGKTTSFIKMVAVTSITAASILVLLHFDIFACHSTFFNSFSSLRKSLTTNCVSVNSACNCNVCQHAACMLCITLNVVKIDGIEEKVHNPNGCSATESAMTAVVAFESTAISYKRFNFIVEHLLKLCVTLHRAHTYTQCFSENGFDIDKSNGM